MATRSSPDRRGGAGSLAGQSLLSASGDQRAPRKSLAKRIAGAAPGGAATKNGAPQPGTREHWLLVENLIKQAIAEGRHGPTPSVCEVCREWVDAIYHVSPTTGTRMCRGCAEISGVKVGPING